MIQNKEWENLHRFSINGKTMTALFLKSKGIRKKCLEIKYLFRVLWNKLLALYKHVTELSILATRGLRTKLFTYIMCLRKLSYIQL